MAPITTGLQTSGTDFIGLNQAMKIIFSEPLTDNIIADSELLDVFEQDMNVQTDETTGGQFIQLAHYFQLPGTVGARAEMDYLPEPVAPKFDNSQIFLKKNQATVQMSGEAYRRAKQGEGAFISWAERALPDLVRRLTNDIDRQLMGYGQGILARVADASPSTTVNLTAAYGVAGLTNANLLFLEGQTLRYSPNPDASSPRALVAQVTLTSNAGTAGQITINQLPTSAALNDYIFNGDANATSGRDGGTIDKELMGLLGMVDDGTILATFQGLARANYTAWNCVSVDSSQTPYNQTLSEDVLMQLDQDVYQLGNGRPDVCVTSRSGWRSYWKSLKGDRLFPFTPGSGADYKGGGRRLEIDLGDRTLEMRVCRKCPPQVTFLIERASFKRWHNTGFFWDDTTGSIWNRVTDSTGRKDAYYATGLIVMQTGNLAPRHSGIVRNLLPA